jgi:alpha-ketoglutarate-dependent taurine dioxygenase
LHHYGNRDDEDKAWDNASLLHSATLIDPNDARTLWRITMKEERRPS